MVLKEKIHQLVDACEDDSTLLEIQDFLQQQTSDNQDWWLQLPDVEKEKTLASIEQLSNGQTLSHQQVMKKIWAKFTK